MMTIHSLNAFGTRLRDLIQRGLPSEEMAFQELALELFRLQFAYNLPFQKVCLHRGFRPEAIARWNDIPAMPAVAFKELELTSLLPEDRVTVFHSSGTTEHRPSRHFHNKASLAVYEQSLLSWFQCHVLPERQAGELPTASPDKSLWMLSLTPRRREAPHSSLVHMMETVSCLFRSDRILFAGSVNEAGVWSVNHRAATDFLQAAEASGQPVTVLGTAFSFVHLLDYLRETEGSIALPSGSRVMETGGYKGRSREMPKPELHRLLTERLGVPGPRIICEYGMSELSSQAYDGQAGNPERAYHFPPWARARVISPETGLEVAEGETGLVRVLDLANVYSVVAVQTEDLAVRRGNGFELLGRARLAETRGCSLMAS